MSELKLEVGKRYEDRSGHIVDIVCLNPNDTLYKYVGIRANGWASAYKYNGRCQDNEPGTILITEYTEPKKLSGWINIYPDGTSETIHKTKEEADKYASNSRLACIDLSQFDVGEGL